MDIGLKDGRVNYKVSLDIISAPSAKKAFYKLDGAILVNKKDVSDEKAYFYTAFVSDQTMFMLRVQAGKEPFVDWNYKFVQPSSDDIFADPLLHVKEANNIVPGSTGQNKSVYMIGRN